MTRDETVQCDKSTSERDECTFYLVKEVYGDAVSFRLLCIQHDDGQVVLALGVQNGEAYRARDRSMRARGLR